MTGLEAVIRVRTVSPQTKVLILTASGVTESEARKAGAHAYHHKAGPLFWLPDALIRLHAEDEPVRTAP